MAPPAHPKSKRDMKYNSQIIQELEELGILEDVTDTVFNSQNLSIPEIQRLISDRFNYTDIGTAEINFLLNSNKTPQSFGRGRGVGRPRQNKTINDSLKNDFAINEEDK